MALPMLVGGGAECGPSNPLQGLTKRFDQDRGLQQVCRVCYPILECGFTHRCLLGPFRWQSRPIQGGAQFDFHLIMYLWLNAIGVYRSSVRRNRPLPPLTKMLPISSGRRGMQTPTSNSCRRNRGLRSTFRPCILRCLQPGTCKHPYRCSNISRISWRR